MQVGETRANSSLNFYKRYLEKEFVQMKKWALGLLVLAATAGAAAPSFAEYSSDRADSQEIRLNGKVFHGNWAFIDDRVYVSVDAFARQMGLPHNHNALNWQLSEGGKGNPYSLGVDVSNSKVPTVRFAGTTMVDLQKACAALKVPYHHDFDSGTYEAGTPFVHSYAKGSYYRQQMRRDARNVANPDDDNNTSWTKDRHPEERPSDKRNDLEH